MPRSPNPPDEPKRDPKLEEKRLKALELRVRGNDYPSIGKALGWTPIEAKAEIEQALGMFRMERIEGERSLDARRYDSLLAKWWDKATADDKEAADVVLKILAQRAKLLGLNVPERHELTGKDGAPIGGILATQATARELVKEFFGENALPPAETAPENG